MNKIRNQETKNQDFRKIANTTQLDICDYYKVNHPSTLIKSSNSHAAEIYALLKFNKKYPTFKFVFSFI